MDIIHWLDLAIGLGGAALFVGALMLTDRIGGRK